MDNESVAFTEGCGKECASIVDEMDVEAEKIRTTILEKINSQFSSDNCYRIAKNEMTKPPNIPLQPILQRVIDNQNYYSQLYVACVEKSTDFVKQLKITMNALFDSYNLKKEEEKMIEKVECNNSIRKNKNDYQIITEYIEETLEDFESSQKEYEDIKKIVDSAKNLLNVTRKMNL
uniref:Uncharacterized protein n=1 Tax=Strongyloides papillosus TaxID=174720 RepID=A0A0N5BXA2_STREA